MQTRRSFMTLTISAVVGASDLAEAVAATSTAAVLIHAKTSSPDSLSAVAGALSGAGITSISPEMPWSRSRYLSENWEEAMAEVDAAVQSVKKSASKVVLIGHSMGCPAAMSFAVTRGGISGLVLASAGHDPTGFYARLPDIKESVDRAKAMVKAGKGNEVADFADENDGVHLTPRLTADGYLSYMSPNGPSNMRTLAGRIRNPVLWLAGSDDRLASNYESIGRQVTRSPKSKFAVVSGATHRSTPSVAAQDIAAWVTAL